MLYLNGLEGKKLEELLEYVLIQLRFFSVNFMKQIFFKDLHFSLKLIK